ncbi:hypothetical protein M8J77_022311 [Diaphorina citri]|nr:hypothetical protein M8J77_022311 [Diaphorina citri]
MLMMRSRMTTSKKSTYRIVRLLVWYKLVTCVCFRPTVMLQSDLHARPLHASVLAPAAVIPDLRNVQKLTYLKSVLCGKPAKLLSSVRLTDDNYCVAVQILKAHYDIPGLVVTKLYDNLIALKPASDKISDMHSFYLELEIRLKLLENQNCNLEPEVLKNHLFKTLSSDLQQELVKEHGVKITVKHCLRSLE